MKGPCKAGLAVYPGPRRHPDLGGELGPALLLQLAQDGPLMIIAGALVKEQPPRKLLPVELCSSRAAAVSRWRDVTPAWARCSQGLLAQAMERSCQLLNTASSQQHIGTLFQASATCIDSMLCGCLKGSVLMLGKQKVHPCLLKGALPKTARSASILGSRAAWQAVGHNTCAG